MCRAFGRAAGGAAALGCLLLAACTIEVGPPPESDPPLVPQTAKAPPPPPQPTEPQPWSRDLDLESVPVAADRERLAKGLVPANVEPTYSGERLTFESAFNPEKPPSEAEQTRQRALQRAKEAGLPPPPALAAVPVTEVEAQSLDAPAGGALAAAPKRESRLPPPPKFPPLPPEDAGKAPAETAAAAEAQPAAESGPEPVAAPRAPEPWSARKSRLPAPPKLPPVEPAALQTASTEPAAPPVEPGAAGASPAAEVAALESGSTEQSGSTEPADFVAEAWDAPSGTILVQVSAVTDGTRVAEEWECLRARYPQVLKPLRLVVEEAKLGDRGVFYRVQAGAFGSQEVAAAACDSLISQGQACFVVVR